jgi:hypothetical protein
MQIEADGEEEDDRPDLRERLDQLRVRDQAEDRWADQDPDQDLPTTADWLIRDATM